MTALLSSVRLAIDPHADSRSCHQMHLSNSMTTSGQNSNQPSPVQPEAEDALRLEALGRPEAAAEQPRPEATAEQPSTKGRPEATAEQPSTNKPDASALCRLSSLGIAITSPTTNAVPGPGEMSAVMPTHTAACTQGSKAESTLNRQLEGMWQQHMLLDAGAGPTKPAPVLDVWNTTSHVDLVHASPLSSGMADGASRPLQHGLDSTQRQLNSVAEEEVLSRLVEREAGKDELCAGVEAFSMATFGGSGSMLAAESQSQSRSVSDLLEQQPSPDGGVASEHASIWL